MKNALLKLGFTVAAATMALPDNAKAQSAATSSAINATIATGQQNFIMISKHDAEGYIVDDGKLIFKFPVGLGTNRNDANTELTNNATPEGEFGGQISSDPLALRISGNSVIYFQCNPSGSTCASIHATYKAEFAARTAKLNSPATSDNFFSHGCINVRPDEMQAVLNFMANNRNQGGTAAAPHALPHIIVLPYNENQVISQYSSQILPASTPR